MEYTALDILLQLVFVSILQILGVYFHVFKTIKELGDKFPDKEKNEIIAIFKKEEWDSMRISCGIVVLYIVLFLALHIYGQEVIKKIPFFPFSAILLALIVGYCGQAILYKIFGTSERILIKSVDKVEQKFN